VSTDHDHAPSKRVRAAHPLKDTQIWYTFLLNGEYSKQIVSDKHIKEMHHAAAAKVLGSSANVTITPVHPLAKLCMLIAILLTHNALLGQQTGRADVGHV